MRVALQHNDLLEIAFFATLVLIVVILATEWLRTHVRGGGKLPPPVILFIRVTLGIVFVILGIIGSLLPVMQGWLFFLLAVLVLFPQSKFAIKACDKIEPKMPRMVAWLRRRGIGTHREESKP